jgi:hypothetical protein
MRRLAQSRRLIAALGRALSAPRRLALRCFALFAVVLVALPAWAGAAEKYQCRYSKRVMASCCCKAKHNAAKQADSAPQARAPSCCDTLRQAASSASANVRDTAQSALEASSVSSLGALVPIASETPARLLKLSADASVDARAGPAIFLRDCRLLS